MTDNKLNSGHVDAVAGTSEPTGNTRNFGRHAQPATPVNGQTPPATPDSGHSRQNPANPRPPANGRAGGISDVYPGQGLPIYWREDPYSHARNILVARNMIDDETFRRMFHFQQTLRDPAVLKYLSCMSIEGREFLLFECPNEVKSLPEWLADLYSQGVDAGLAAQVVCQMLQLADSYFDLQAGGLGTLTPERIFVDGHQHRFYLLMLPFSHDLITEFDRPFIAPELLNSSAADMMRGIARQSDYYSLAMLYLTLRTGQLPDQAPVDSLNLNGPLYDELAANSSVLPVFRYGFPALSQGQSPADQGGKKRSARGVTGGHGQSGTAKADDGYGENPAADEVPASWWRRLFSERGRDGGREAGREHGRDGGRERGHEGGHGDGRDGSREVSRDGAHEGSHQASGKIAQKQTRPAPADSDFDPRHNWTASV